MPRREPSIEPNPPAPARRDGEKGRAQQPHPFERAKRHLALACASIGAGLACAGSVDRTTGGVLVLVGWAGAVLALHRLGRAGSERAPAERAPAGR